MTIQESLLKWAERTVNGTEIKGIKFAGFNEISKDTSTQYTLQSPLDQINNTIDTLVLGINLRGAKSGSTEISPDAFLKGNEFWKNRFNDNQVSREWATYFGLGHKMICGNQERDNLLLDNDEKTVWENLTPFVTPNSKLLESEHWEAGLRSTAELITILKPKRIILFSTEGFNLLAPYIKVEHLPIVKDAFTKKTIEIGTIDRYPAIQLSHPSRAWITHFLFLPMIVQLHQFYAVNKKNVPLEKAATDIKSQLRRIEVI